MFFHVAHGRDGAEEVTPLSVSPRCRRGQNVAVGAGAGARWRAPASGEGGLVDLRREPVDQRLEVGEPLLEVGIALLELLEGGVLLRDLAVEGLDGRQAHARRVEGSDVPVVGPEAEGGGEVLPLLSWISSLVVPSLPLTCSLFDGEAVPMPTLPLALMSMLLVGAPGRMRKGRREPPVTSRTKKFASLPAMSQVCAVKPPELFWSSRMAGVLLVATWMSSTGVLVCRPSRPVESTKTELVGALPVTVNGTVAAVMSSIENLLAPPLAESFAVSCQSWFGKPVPVLVSSNLMRVLFSFSRMVSKPKLSLLTQSRPMQALPCTIRSSAITWSSTGRPVGLPAPAPLTGGSGLGSTASGATSAPATTRKVPDCTRSPDGSRPALRSRSTVASLPEFRAAARARWAAPSMAGTTRSS